MLSQNTIQPLPLLRRRERKALRHSVQLLEVHPVEIARKLHRQRLAQEALLYEPRHMALDCPRVRVLLRSRGRVGLDPRDEGLVLRVSLVQAGGREGGMMGTVKSWSTSAEG